MHRSLVFAIALALVVTTARATTWQIDSAHSSVQFSVRHLMISNVRGTFHAVTGTVRVAEGDPRKATVEAAVDPATVDTQEPKRDAHLRSPDFLGTDQFKTVTFKSTRIEAGDAGHWKVTGDLTLHGVTKSVVLDVEGPTAEVQFGDAIRAGAHATATIDRRDFGITWSKAIEGGGIVVGNEIALTIEVEATKQAD